MVHVILMSGGTTPQHPYPTPHKPKRHQEEAERHAWSTRQPGASPDVPGTCDGPLDKLDKPWYNTRVEFERKRAAARQLRTPHTSTKNRTMLTVKVRRNENPERAVSRLKNMMMKEGTLNDLKAKRYFQKPSLKRRLKRENAARQRVKDLHKEIRAAQREEDNFLQ